MTDEDWADTVSRNVEHLKIMVDTHGLSLNLSVKQSDDFVTIVHYRVTAVDGDYTASTYGTVGYTQESETFIPFADLTEATVVGWVKGVPR
jgi:hypothetical protein